MIKDSENTFENRFWPAIDRSGKCWLWLGYIHPNGYGSIRFRNRVYLAHRFAYENLKGPIPQNKCLDHLCRTRHCCNPDHLEIVSLRENIRRGQGVAGINRRKIKCVRNHSFKKFAYTDNYGRRICRECKRIARREYLKRHPGRR